MNTIRYLHTMLRVLNLEQSLDFYVNKLGLQLIRRKDYESGRYTLVFLGPTPDEPILELTHNWDQSEPYSIGRNFGHVAFGVSDIYATCQHLQAQGVDILRPPRDGRMAFIKSPDGASVELLQIGEALPVQEPWASMANQGSW